MDYSSINLRYSQLAKTDCCLSCGGALNYSKVKPGEVCVDLGSGRGTDVLRMAEQAGESGFAYGIDISDGMLTTARENAVKFGVNNVKFIRIVNWRSWICLIKRPIWLSPIVRSTMRPIKRLSGTKFTGY